LERLRGWGFVEPGRDEVRVHRHGLLQIDRLLQEFFLPHHRNARYA
jgi:oxygen-independent coproporphyrinogen-3 oxidase